jgi:Uma2 family endonuclease
VLSPSNTRVEIDLKLRRYREAPDNLYAVVIDPRKFMVEIYSKSRKWEPVVFKRPDDVIEMPEFGLRCTVLDLYRGTLLAQCGRLSSNIITETGQLRFELCKAAIKKYDELRE